MGISGPRVNVETLSPRYCVWELTLACNLRCEHCGSRAGAARPDELTTAECLQLVRDLAGLGCQVITLSGGEPTLRKDWLDIAHEIRAQGMIPNMVTNGVALDDRTARDMRQVLSNVAISLDGPEAVHDQIRGPGSFARAARGVGLLIEAGVSVTVMTTLSKLNLSSLEATYQTAVGLGAARWRCQLGKRMGQLEDHQDWVISPRDLLRVLPTLYALNEEGPIPVGIGDSLGFHGPFDTQLRAVNWKGQPQRWAGCQAGLSGIGIEANGGVKGCLSLQALKGEKDPFIEGNIRERPLTAIWRDPDLFAYNRQFSPDSLTGFCKGCTHRLSCRGGARCVAAAATGSLGEDPYCYHRVSCLATRWPRVSPARKLFGAASAASVLMMGLGSCVIQSDYGVEPTPTPDVTPTPVAAPEYGVEPTTPPAEQPDYGVEPTAGLEYGVEPTDEPTYAPEYGVEPTDEPTYAPEYGVEPTDEPTYAPEYGVEPTDEPTYAPEYGVEPTPDPTVMPDYGVEPTATPISCEAVCCDCDYGTLPDETYQACCQQATATPTPAPPTPKP